MLIEIFYWLVNMSITASIAGIIICLLGKIRTLPRRIVNLLWLIPLIRFWIPFGINSKWSLLSILLKSSVKTVPVPSEISALSMTNAVQAADTYFPVSYKTILLEKIFFFSSILWVTIVVALLLFVIIGYSTAKAEAKSSIHLFDNIYISDKVSSPASYGIFKTIILLPKTYCPEEMTFILAHEKAHQRRKDNLWRLVALVTVCVHWFNPIAWLFFKSFLESLELACDESVLSRYGESQKKAYASILLNCAEAQSIFSSDFGGARIRPRLSYILSYRNLSLMSLAAFLMLAIAIGYVLLTNAK